MTDLLSPPAPTKAAKVTAADIRAALIRRFSDPEWAVLFEVRNATGFADNVRSADAIAMSLWPSRGLELYGMEIKVSRYDWQKERATPEKAESIASYCDRWLLVTGHGVVADISEIPPAWGWLEYDGKQLIQRREAAKTEARLCDRKFLAALLRRVSKTDDALLEAEVARRVEAINRDFDERVKRAAESRTSYGKDLVKDVEEFEAAAGFKIKDGWSHSPNDVGRAVKAVLASGIDGTYSGLAGAMASLREQADKIQQALSDIGLEPRPAPKKRGQR